GQLVICSGLLAGIVAQRLLQCGGQDAFYQTRLTRTGNTGYHRQYAKRKPGGDMLQVIFAGTFYFYKIVPFTALRRYGYLLLTRQVTACKAIIVFNNFIISA